MTANPVAAAAGDQVRRRIIDGTYPSGSRLPAERTLSVELDISRTALRDALKGLEATGFIEVRAGRRYVAAVSGDDGGDAAFHWLLQHRNDLESLNEVRELLEPKAVMTIPTEKVPSVAAAAAEIVDRQTQAILAGYLHVAADLDADFHRALIAATPNTPLRELTAQLVNLARVHAARIYQMPGVAAHSLSQHEDIVTALRNGELPRAAHLVAEHARTAFRYALSQEPPSGLPRG